MTTAIPVLISLNDLDAYSHDGDVVVIDYETFAADTVEELAAIAKAS